MDQEQKSSLKSQIRSAFTEFPFCIATYLTLGGFIAFLVIGIKYHLTH